MILSIRHNFIVLIQNLSKPKCISMFANLQGDILPVGYPVFGRGEPWSGAQGGFQNPWEALHSMSADSEAPEQFYFQVIQANYLKESLIYICNHLIKGIELTFLFFCFYHFRFKAGSFQISIIQWVILCTFMPLLVEL